MTIKLLIFHMYNGDDSCQSPRDDKDFQEPSGSVVVAQNVPSNTSSEIDKDETQPLSPVSA